jgi:hypothetical protein
LAGTKEDLKRGSTTYYYYGVIFFFSKKKKKKPYGCKGLFNIRTLNGAARFPNRKNGKTHKHFSSSLFFLEDGSLCVCVCAVVQLLPSCVFYIFSFFVSLFAAEITSRMMMMKKEMRKMAG